MVSARRPDRSTTGIRCRLSQEPSEKGAYWPLIDKAPETPNPRSRVRCYGLSTRQPLAPEAVTANHVESYPVAARVVFSSQPESSACATAVECMMTAIAAAPALRTCCATEPPRVWAAILPPCSRTAAKSLYCQAAWAAFAHRGSRTRPMNSIVFVCVSRMRNTNGRSAMKCGGLSTTGMVAPVAAAASVPASSTAMNA